jgi:UDP-N-acetylmuramoyl-tripeptide--D-alanyl-D-alanine ligase
VRARRLLQLLQLEHYENARLLLWLRRRDELVDVLDGGLLALAVAAVVLAAAVADVAGAVAALALTGLAAVRAAQTRPRAEIKPLVWTGRAKRLFAAGLAPAVLAVAAAAVGWAVGSEALAEAGLAAAAATVLAAPWLLPAANRALAPVQTAINRRYVRRAERRLRDWAPLTVGITGSYGKTTTKFCVAAVLGLDRPTLATPESYNSHLGVVRTINEHLTAEHRAFVVEMGMYRAGDIRELCDLVHPTVGLITAIGPVHLERLGSIEAIAAAKGEMAEAMPPDGRFVTNGDDARCREQAERSAAPVTLYGIDSPDAAVRATDIAIADGRTSFTLVLPGERHEVSAGLLGRHNVLNLLAAAAVGHVVGLSGAQIARGLATVEPPEHRLQPIHNRRAGIVVIDDAYNANPAGAAAALEVLRDHPATRRILVTPGMVELGDLEEELNREFGRQAAAVCDLVILVGPARTRPIREGLAESGFDDGAVIVARDMKDAAARIATVSRSGDAILFENDLPDTYAEPVPEQAAAPA